MTNYHHLLLPASAAELTFAALLWEHFRRNELHSRLIFMRANGQRDERARVLSLCDDLRCPPVVAKAIFALTSGDGIRHPYYRKHLLHWCEKRSKKRDWFNGRRRP